MHVQKAGPTPQVALILHAMFMLAVLVYAALAHLLIPTLPNRPPFDPMFAYLFVGLGLFQIPLGFVLPAIMAKKGSNPPVMFIVTDACFEAIAIYGLVGTILSMPLLYADGLMALSFILLAANTIRLRTMREAETEF